MGTRCDFYLGRGPQARWLGSIARDAYVDAMAERFRDVTTPELFQERLQAVFAEYGEIPASAGWPWPWRDSHTTDTVVAFDQGQCWTAHPERVWASLERYDEPTSEPLTFPDMRSVDEATPEGRLRRKLRFGCDFAVGPDQDVMQQVLWRCAALLTRAFQHGAWRTGTYWTMAAHWGRPLEDLNALASVLQSSGDDFRQLLAQRRSAHAEREWDLLTWLLAHQGTWGMSEQAITLREHPDAPVFFGLPCSAEYRAGHLDSVLPFYYSSEPVVIREGQELLDLVLQRAPSLVSLLWEDYFLKSGLFHVQGVPREKAKAWLARPHSELGGLTADQAATTMEGRLSLRRFGARLIWDSKEFLVDREALRNE